jgi:hypothetical protein
MAQSCSPVLISMFLAHHTNFPGTSHHTIMRHQSPAQGLERHSGPQSTHSILTCNEDECLLAALEGGGLQYTYSTSTKGSSTDHI